jgi:DNA-binding GntR family transcriptional regulator
MEMTPSAPVQPKPTSAADRVYAYVKHGIISRRFGTEELLAEGQIAEALAVSRTPVREGLLRLEAEGLVKLLPKRGVLVVAVTADEVRDVLETRRLVEVHAVRKIAQAGSSSQLLATLADHLAEMHRTMSQRDTAAYVLADRAFHAEIVHAAGNEILIHLYSSLRDRQLRMGVANLLDHNDSRGNVARMRTTLSEHQAIVEAISRGSLRACDAAVNHHLDTTEAVLGKFA